MAQSFLNWIINLQPAGFSKLQIGMATLGVIFLLFLVLLAIGLFVYKWIADLRETAEAEACAEKWHQEFKAAAPKSPLRDCAQEFVPHKIDYDKELAAINGLEDAKVITSQEAVRRRAALIAECSPNAPAAIDKLKSSQRDLLKKNQREMTNAEADEILDGIDPAHPIIETKPADVEAVYRSARVDAEGAFDQALDDLAERTGVAKSDLIKPIPAAKDYRGIYKPTTAKGFFIIGSFFDIKLMKGGAVCYNTLTKKQVQYRMRKVFLNYSEIKSQLVYKKSRLVLAPGVDFVILQSA